MHYLFVQLVPMHYNFEEEWVHYRHITLQTVLDDIQSTITDECSRRPRCQLTMKISTFCFGLKLAHVMHAASWQLYIYIQWKGWSWSCSSWIYNYLCNRCLSPLKLWVRTPFMANIRFNLIKIRYPHASFHAATSKQPIENGEQVRDKKNMKIWLMKHYI